MKSRPLCSFAVLLILSCWSVLASAQPVSARHSQIELMARQNAVAPGAEIQLGVHFTLEKGWHIYWINPGDSGQPPTFKWQLPEGFTVADVQWPRPERMQSNAQLADYGYHDDILLIILLRAPQAIKPSAKAKLAVEAKWLICREVCLPDHASLALDLPVSSQAKENPASAQLFSETIKKLPVALPQGWSVRTTARKDDLVLTVMGKHSVSKAQFFPLDPDQIDNAAPQQLLATPTGAKITLKKSDLLVKPLTALRGVLVLPEGPAFRIESTVR